MNNDNTNTQIDPTLTEAMEDTKAQKSKAETVDSSTEEETFSRARIITGNIMGGFGMAGWKTLEVGVFFMAFYILWALTAWPLWAVFLFLGAFALTFNWLSLGLTTGEWNPVTQFGY